MSNLQLALQNGVVVAWQRVSLYGHTVSDLLVNFVQKDLRIDPKRFKQDGWRLSSFVVSCVVPLVALFSFVNLVLWICCGRRKKRVLVVREEKKEEVINLKQLLPPPARKKLRVPRIDLLDNAYSRMEATRWMRQARLDVRSATNDLKEENGAFEWVCFKCQQAVEKALKACLICADLYAVNLRSHDLCDLASATEDDELIQIASRLQVIIGFAGQVRYPDYLPYPKIPNELYSFEQATRVMELTRIMMEVISEKSFNDIDVMGTDLITGDRIAPAAAAATAATTPEASAARTEENAEFSDS